MIQGDLELSRAVQSGPKWSRAIPSDLEQSTVIRTIHKKWFMVNDS